MLSQKIIAIETKLSNLITEGRKVSCIKDENKRKVQIDAFIKKLQAREKNINFVDTHANKTSTNIINPLKLEWLEVKADLYLIQSSFYTAAGEFETAYTELAATADILKNIEDLGKFSLGTNKTIHKENFVKLSERYIDCYSINCWNHLVHLGTNDNGQIDAIVDNLNGMENLYARQTKIVQTYSNLFANNPYFVKNNNLTSSMYENIADLFFDLADTTSDNISLSVFDLSVKAYQLSIAHSNIEDADRLRALNESIESILAAKAAFTEDANQDLGLEPGGQNAIQIPSLSPKEQLAKQVLERLHATGHDIATRYCASHNDVARVATILGRIFRKIIDSSLEFGLNSNDFNITKKCKAAYFSYLLYTEEAHANSTHPLLTKEIVSSIKALPLKDIQIQNNTVAQLENFAPQSMPPDYDCVKKMESIISRFFKQLQELYSIEKIASITEDLCAHIQMQYKPFADNCQKQRTAQNAKFANEIDFGDSWLSNQNTPKLILNYHESITKRDVGEKHKQQDQTPSIEHRKFVRY